MDGNIEKMQSLTGRIKGLGIDKTLTKKGMCAEAEATGKALATKVSITDIVDDFLSVATDKPLSANQGRLLKKQIEEIDPHYAENVLYNDTNVKDALDKVSKAENIAYNEKSVKGAIDELSDNVEDVQTQLEWKYGGLIQGTTVVDMSNICPNWKELYVTMATSEDATENYCITFDIKRISFNGNHATGDKKLIYNGYYNKADDYLFACVEVTNTKIRNVYRNKNGTSTVNTCKTRFYWR